MRVRNKPWAIDYIREHNEWVVLEPAKKKGHWKGEFKKPEHPLHLEIGSGNGGFIKGMAERNPNINFIGMEIEKNIIVNAIDRLKDESVGNVRLMHENAHQVGTFFDDGELDTLYLNFSDPWPKNRHEKRRLTYQAFLEQYKRIIKKDGSIILKTDNRHLFEYSLVQFSHVGFILEDVTFDLHALADSTNVMTEYEEKFSAKGQPIYRSILRNSN